MFTFGPAMWAWISTAPAMTVLPCGINDLCTGTNLVNDLSVLYGDILLVALDALDRVKYVTVLDDIF